MFQNIRKLLALAILLMPNIVYGQTSSLQNPRIGFIIHGGAGATQKDLTPEKKKALKEILERVVLAGFKALQNGKSSLDAVETAIRMMEDSPMFNAGKGAVFTHDGKNELDASIMNGKTLAAGAVAGVHHVKNPITLARAVMERSRHVMMVGDGAEKFAKEQQIELVDEKYFWTQQEWDNLQRALKAEQTSSVSISPTSHFGTVGAVALDRDGNLAAGTSTGGLTNKKYGRVGDSPIIGAGTYANNDSCGVSATGVGEYFIRLGVARDIASLMEYRGLPVQVAADTVIKQKLTNLGGKGGVIAMDKSGNIAASYNTEGMYRAYIDSEGKPVVQFFKD